MFSCRQQFFFDGSSTSDWRNRSKKICRKCCFSRISEDTLGSFSALFWDQVVLQGQGVLLPAAVFFEQQQHQGLEEEQQQQQVTKFVENVVTVTIATLPVVSSCQAFFCLSTILSPGSAAGAAALK